MGVLVFSKQTHTDIHEYIYTNKPKKCWHNWSVVMLEILHLSQAPRCYCWSMKLTLTSKGTEERKYTFQSECVASIYSSVVIRHSIKWFLRCIPAVQSQYPEFNVALRNQITQEWLLATWIFKLASDEIRAVIYVSSWSISDRWGSATLTQITLLLSFRLS